jgi:hypothetical protein
VESAVSAPARSRALSTALASVGFVILIVGITYFALLVLAIRYDAPDARASAYYELGQFLTGGLPWYQNAQVYGATALLCALASLLFGVSPLARITIPIAGACYVTLFFFREPIMGALIRWAQQSA